MRKWVKGKYEARLNLLLTSDPVSLQRDGPEIQFFAFYQAKERGRNIIDYKVTWNKSKPINQKKQSWETWRKSSLSLPGWGDKMCTFCKEHSVISVKDYQRAKLGPGPQLSDEGAWWRRGMEEVHVSQAIFSKCYVWQLSFW